MDSHQTASARHPLKVGVDLGGTNMQIGLVDAEGRIVGRCKRKTRARRGLETVLDRLVEGVERACADASVKIDEVASIGIGVPGAIDLPRGVVLEAPNLGWTDQPVRDLIAARIGRPVVLDNDVNVAIWGEAQRGAGRGHGDLLGVWIGTGVGGGLVLGRNLFRGQRHTAGEIGQTVVQPAGPPFGRTLEHLASRTGMVHQIQELLKQRPDSALHRILDEGDGELGSSEIAAAFHAGDDLVSEVVEHGAALLGASIANLVSVLSLGAVVIGGGVTEAMGDALLDRIRHHFRRWVFPARLRDVPLLMTELGADAGIHGAALLADSAAAASITTDR